MQAIVQRAGITPPGIDREAKVQCQPRGQRVCERARKVEGARARAMGARKVEGGRARAMGARVSEGARVSPLVPLPFACVLGGGNRHKMNQPLLCAV